MSLLTLEMLAASLHHFRIEAQKSARFTTKKKNMKFYTQFGENRPEGSKQVFTKPSMTEPDNTLSIPEIIARYTRGQGFGVNQRVWQSGTASEDGEREVPQDSTLEDVLGINPQGAEPATPEPSAPATAPAAAPAASAAAPAAAPAEPAPAPAPAGA